MKYSLIALALFTASAMAQFPGESNTLRWEPNLNTGPGGTLTDEHGNRWIVTPNLNTGPGATITRQRQIYRMLRNREYRQNYGSRGTHR